MLPSLRRSRAGFAVLLTAAMLGCAMNSAADAPGPEPGLPPRGITMMSSSG